MKRPKVTAAVAAMAALAPAAAPLVLNQKPLDYDFPEPIVSAPSRDLGAHDETHSEKQETSKLHFNQQTRPAFSATMNQKGIVSRPPTKLRYEAQ